jgi:hypothetical protein
LINNGTASGVNGLKTTGLPQLAALISKEPVFLARPGPWHVLARTASMSRERQLARDTDLTGVITLVWGLVAGFLPADAVSQVSTYEIGQEQLTHVHP